MLTFAKALEKCLYGPIAIAAKTVLTAPSETCCRIRYDGTTVLEIMRNGLYRLHGPYPMFTESQVKKFAWRMRKFGPVNVTVDGCNVVVPWGESVRFGTCITVDGTGRKRLANDPPPDFGAGTEAQMLKISEPKLAAIVYSDDGERMVANAR